MAGDPDAAGSLPKSQTIGNTAPQDLVGPRPLVKLQRGLGWCGASSAPEAGPIGNGNHPTYDPRNGDTRIERFAQV